MSSFLRSVLFVLFFSGVCPHANSQWLGLKVSQVIPTSERIYNLAVARTNSDAFKDIVALPFDNFTNLHIYRGKSDFQFEFGFTMSKGEYYRVLRTGDLDSDGIDELVMSGYWENGFKIFWGNEDGSYSPGIYYALTGHGKNIEITDINGDNFLDIIALSGGSGQPITLHIFTGNDTRQLTASGIFPSILHTDTRITVVDKDENGLPDVMVSSSFPWFVIFYQSKGGKFTPRYWPYKIEMPFTSAYYLSDLSNDGREDIMASYWDEGLRFYEGKSDTLFNEQYTSVPLTFNPYRIYTTDLNNDGFIDIVMDHHSAEYEPTDTLHYVLGRGDLTFEQPEYIVLPASVDNYVVEDFNDDGFRDIIAYCKGKGIVTVLNEGLATGIEEGSVSQMFPNPFSDELTINFQNHLARITVYNSQGTCMRKVSAQDSCTINTSSWPSGLYIAEIETKGTIKRQKIIKN